MDLLELSLHRKWILDEKEEYSSSSFTLYRFHKTSLLNSPIDMPGTRIAGSVQHSLIVKLNQPQCKCTSYRSIYWKIIKFSTFFFSTFLGNVFSFWDLHIMFVFAAAQCPPPRNAKRHSTISQSMAKVRMKELLFPFIVIVVVSYGFSQCRATRHRQFLLDGPEDRRGRAQHRNAFTLHCQSDGRVSNLLPFTN